MSARVHTRAAVPSGWTARLSGPCGRQEGRATRRTLGGAVGRSRRRTERLRGGAEPGRPRARAGALPIGSRPGAEEASYAAPPMREATLAASYRSCGCGRGVPRRLAWRELDGRCALQARSAVEGRRHPSGGRLSHG
ncbi:hypothetical protein GCM10010287_62770 [Streptomyces variabilis]|uniref:Uncharacterized protein n=1 Tax=Streptomyces variabilis TaxID=67372 RepID=A0ABQ2U8C1_9ACTN|nr:hypothetical protein GCM10010265_06520 [Streptomyces griseoincarnatus]GGT79859.1 hypothetical protein GCM10010287_62770 [Streptomyces variabilis]